MILSQMKASNYGPSSSIFVQNHASKNMTGFAIQEDSYEQSIRSSIDTTIQNNQVILKNKDGTSVILDGGTGGNQNVSRLASKHPSLQSLTGNQPVVPSHNYNQKKEGNSKMQQYLGQAGNMKRITNGGSKTP